MSEIQKLTGDGQIIFILLLSLARQRGEVADREMVWAAAVELDDAMATALLAQSRRLPEGSEPRVPSLESMLQAFERSVATGDTAADSHLTDRLSLYGALIAAIERLASELLDTGPYTREVQEFAVQE